MSQAVYGRGAYDFAADRCLACDMGRRLRTSCHWYCAGTHAAAPFGGCGTSELEATAEMECGESSRCWCGEQVDRTGNRTAQFSAFHLVTYLIRFRVLMTFGIAFPSWSVPVMTSRMVLASTQVDLLVT